MMRILLWLFLLVSFGSASAATITFEEFDEGTCVCGGVGLETEGFTFEAGGGVAGSIQTVGDDKALQYISYEDTIFSMRAVSGNNFSLSSLDVSASSTFTITGFYSGGGGVSETLLVGNWTTINFDSSWQNLESVEFLVLSDGFGASFDNIDASVVPIPAAIWLFSSALAGLGWIRRQKTI